MQAVALAPGGPKEAINCLAVLKAKIKIKNHRILAGITPKTYDFLRKMSVLTLPRDPPGEDQTL